MFKKLVIGALALAVIAPSFAAQDIYLTFKDGRQAVYKNVPDSVDNAQFANAVMRDYGMNYYTDLDLSKSRIVDVPDAPNAEVQTGFWDSTTGKVVKWVGITVLAVALFKAIGPVASGICNVPSDRARDGSRCGGRAASVRPGGR